MNDHSSCHYDVIVVGGGHAGIEAAYAAAKLTGRVALVTMSRATIGQMSCNPAIGGLAKGQIVREIDALGGLMGLIADQAGIQFRMLNRSKGPAVWAPRAQADKTLYQRLSRAALEAVPNLDIVEGIAARLVISQGRATGIVCAGGQELAAGALVLTTGTFLRGMMHTGAKQWPGGRIDEPAADDLSQSLLDCGVPLERLKTGTPPRLDARSIDYARCEPQPGDIDPQPFSYLNESIDCEQIDCWITYTNEETHRVIQDNLDRAPLYTGQIQSTGPRYCPSIETKIVRFSDKPRHQVFLEPEGRDTDWVYANGISTSLPTDAQDEMVHSIEGLEEACILQYGYAIEYDYVPPLNTWATLESKQVPGLFLAGQINGTSGYEEAAGQGLLAGLNAARQVRRQELVTLGREQAYIGVMIDDLVTKGVSEPYRMFTSRAEHRLLLRYDNADQRLTPWAQELGLIPPDRWEHFQSKAEEIARIRRQLESTKVDGCTFSQRLQQQAMTAAEVVQAIPDLQTPPVRRSSLEHVLHEIRYAGYIEKEQRLIARAAKGEHMRLPTDFDYHQISQLRFEAREKLNEVHPATLGQAQRISGINPADITVLMVFFARQGS